MYYKADIYKDATKTNTLIDTSVETLKSECESYINDNKTTQIVVSEVKEIGFFKIPKELECVIKKDLIL